MTLARYTASAAAAKGWTLGSSLENQAMLALSHLGVRADALAQQHRAGRYRLDFADPDVQIAIEVDGWHHLRPETAAKDAERDSWLRAQGWLVFRVDDRHGPESLADQLCRAVRMINAERDSRGLPKLSGHSRAGRRSVHPSKRTPSNDLDSCRTPASP